MTRKFFNFLYIVIIIILILYGLYYTKILSREERVVWSAPRTEASLDGVVKFDTSFDFLLATGSNTYIKITESEINSLKKYLFSNAVYVLPDGIELTGYSIDIQTKHVYWEDEDGETSYDADGLVMKITAKLNILNNAQLGKNKILLVLPNLPALEDELGAKVTFIGRDVRLSEDRLLIQIINVHETKLKKEIFDNGKNLLLLIGVAFFLSYTLLLISENKDEWWS